MLVYVTRRGAPNSPEAFRIRRPDGYSQVFGIGFLFAGAAARFQKPTATLRIDRLAPDGFGLRKKRPVRAVRIHEFDLHRSFAW